MEQELSQARADAMSKDNHIACLRQQLDRTAKATADLEASLTAHRAELERKHLQIADLISKLEDIERRASPRKDGANLLLDLPGLANTEADAYIETNRGLREELERSRRKLEQTQQELLQQATELETLRACGSENSKLRQMVL